MIPLDVRYAARALLSAPSLTAVVVICLALAIATNTTMFSVVDAMFLRPPPFADADRLVSIAARDPQTGRRVSLTFDDVRELRAVARGVDALAAHSGQTFTLTDVGDPERIPAQLVTANLFPMLGLAPERGQAFDAAHELTSGAAVALISDSLWRRRYQSDPAIVGRVLRLDSLPYTIVGVMPAKVRFPSTSELWIPMAPGLGASGGSSRAVTVIGRLARDATVERANAELSGLMLPPSGARRARSVTARRYASVNIGGEERLIVSALMGGTTVLLLMAVVNVANLLLARGTRRRRELAVRAALGASRWRLVRQLLVESVLLAIAAAALALPLALYAIQWIHDAVPASEPLGPYYVDWSLDMRTLLYSLSIALLTGLAFGIVPALAVASRRIVSPLRESAGSTVTRLQRRVHGGLIVAQIALTLLLLAGASLFVRTYAGQRSIALGYDTSRLMTFRVYFAGAAYDSAEARARAVDAIARGLETIGGAQAATVTDLVPLDDQGGSDSPAAVDGRSFEDGREPTVHYAGVARRWPETFDVRLLAGRTFYEHELQGTAPVALVNAKLAAAFWPGESAVGRRFRLAEDASNSWLTVIGVVPDIRTVKLDESHATPPTAYLPHRFISTRNYGIIIRTKSQPESVKAEVRAIIRAVDSSLALFDVYPMEQVRWLSYWMYVMWGTMFGVLALIALAIAAIGVYGVVFYTVAQRRREIGLRVALGARRGQVVGPMVQHVAALAAGGTALGIAAAAAVTPLVASLLINVTPNDPLGYAVVAGVLGVVALTATWIPAWTASAVDR
jgi:putative ABC transport system permease protein